MTRRLLVPAILAALACAFALTVPARAEIVQANSGLPDSTCVPTKGPNAYTAPGPGVTVNGLGADAPAYHEIGHPTGAFAGRAPKGIMLVIHGGGWFSVGKEMVVTARPLADRWRARGWATVNLDYRGCRQSVSDVAWFMARVRSLRPNAVICATGMSAGAHLALLLASIRTDLGCAIALAGPSDLGALPTQTAYDLTTKTLSNDGPTRLHYAAVAAFGSGGVPLLYSSPSRYAGRVRARLLLGSGEQDFLVPAAQNRNYAALVRASNPAAYVDVAYLEAGDQPFVHDRVSSAALNDFYDRELAVVRPLVGA